MTPTYLCLDNALPNDLADAILARSLNSQAEFLPTTTFGSGSGTGKRDPARRSLKLQGALGPLQAQFEDEARALFPRLCDGCEMSQFPIARLEIEVVAHRDGHYYRPHVDIRFGRGVDKTGASRTLSMVYYVHRQPVGFSGGQIRLLNFDGSGEAIEARHNRLIAFPSIVLHEVMPITVPNDAWADARFSVNCWFLQ